MIIGGGKTGFYLAKKLAEVGTSVKVIEISKERCHYLAANLEDVMVLNGDATDITLLEDENLNEMDAVVTATGFDEENLLLALIAKQHGIEDVIAKVSRDSYAGLTGTMGIDVALNPLDISASNILRMVQGSRHLISSHLIQGQAEIIEVQAGDHMAIMNVPLKELDLPQGILVVAIDRNDELIIPSGGTRIQEGDKAIILCLLSEVPALEKLLRTKKGLHLF
jgi:trk system potassium uptake protein TrkA